MQRRLWIFPAFALITLIVGKICTDTCMFLQGSLLGLDLEVLGIAFYAALLVAVIFYTHLYHKKWFIKAIAAIVSIGVGAEYIFIQFQVQNSIYCAKCIISGVLFLVMFLLLIPHINKWAAILLILCGVIFTSYTFSGSVTPSYADEIDFPSFGNEHSRTEIIIYSDYFCPACRKTDAQAYIMLKKLEDKVKLHFVDVPRHAYSIEYAEVFLYTCRARQQDLETAMKVREILFAAAEKDIRQHELLSILHAKGIAFREDKAYAGEIFRRFYNPLMKTDAIRGTPAIVVKRGDERKKYTGAKQILKTLEEISSTDQQRHY
jgi:hypothetical protein